MDIGTVYSVQPEAPDPALTVWFDGGRLRIGVESRDIDPESLRESYRDDPEGWAEIEATQPAGGFTDAGVSLHVVGAESGHEYLRFDAFDDGPHYHYIRPDGLHNEVVPFDCVANGDSLEWAIGCLSSRVGEMLGRAGGDDLANAVEDAAYAEAVRGASELARRLESLRSK